MRVANFVVKRPMVLGHECAGIVEQVGSQVKSLMIGDRVALEPGISCRQCYLCKDGRYNLCRQMKFFGSPPTNGALANQVMYLLNLSPQSRIKGYLRLGFTSDFLRPTELT